MATAQKIGQCPNMEKYDAIWKTLDDAEKGETLEEVKGYIQNAKKMLSSAEPSADLFVKGVKQVRDHKTAEKYAFKILVHLSIREPHLSFDSYELVSETEYSAFINYMRNHPEYNITVQDVPNKGLAYTRWSQYDFREIKDMTNIKILLTVGRLPSLEIIRTTMKNINKKQEEHYEECKSVLERYFNLQLKRISDYYGKSKPEYDLAPYASFPYKAGTLIHKIRTETEARAAKIIKDDLSSDHLEHLQDCMEGFDQLVETIYPRPE